MLENDLKLEIQVVSALKEVIAYCESVLDFQTREILEVMLNLKTSVARYQAIKILNEQV